MAKKDLLQEREARPSLLARAARHADEYLRSIGERHVGARASGDELRELLRRPLSSDGEASEHVIDELARAAERGATATQSGRYFGFVTGGSLPVATAADWLVSGTRTRKHS